jgi:hypothetical protein
MSTQFRLFSFSHSFPCSVLQVEAIEFIATSQVLVLGSSRRLPLLVFWILPLNEPPTPIKVALIALLCPARVPGISSMTGRKSIGNVKMNGKETPVRKSLFHWLAAIKTKQQQQQTY